MLLAEENSVLLRGGDGDGEACKQTCDVCVREGGSGEGFQEGRDIGCSLRLLKVFEQPAPGKGFRLDLGLSGSLYAAHPRYPRLPTAQTQHMRADMRISYHANAYRL